MAPILRSRAALVALRSTDRERALAILLKALDLEITGGTKDGEKIVLAPSKAAFVRETAGRKTLTAALTSRIRRDATRIRSLRKYARLPFV